MIFLNGNSDVVTRILEFVAESSEELNTCAMISRVFRISRSDRRFDQTRTGTIILKTFLTNIPLEVWQRWNQQVFTGNRVRLVAILTQLSRVSSYLDELPFALSNVREVIFHRDSSVKVPASFDECEHGGVNAVGFFKKILPNLDILDIGALAVTTIDLGGPLNFPGNVLWNLRASVFRCSAEVICRGCHFRLMQPHRFRVDANMHSLREIHIDPFGVSLGDHSPPITAFCQEYSQLEQEEWFRIAAIHNNGADWVLLQEYPNLERVTLKHADYRERYNRNPSNRFWKALPHEALIKFVRHTSKLRWFCSDLTQENIVILREERPEVEFRN
jgi:hypothetical protein